MSGGGDRDDEVDHGLVGKLGRITVAVRPHKPGEVVLGVRGGREAFAAWSDEVLPKGTEVVVVDRLEGRSVFVTPFS